MAKARKSQSKPKFKGATRQPTYIRHWRLFRDLTLEELADRIKMSVGNLSQIETGTYAYTQDALEAIAFGLSCTPADLLQRNPHGPEAPWSLWEKLLPDQRKVAIRVLKALADESEGIT